MVFDGRRTMENLMAGHFHWVLLMLMKLLCLSDIRYVFNLLQI